MRNSEKVIKKILKILAILLLAGYLVASFFLWKDEDDKQVCRNFYITVRDSVDRHFITAADIYRFVDEAKLNPQGKPCGAIDPMTIEKCVSQIELLTQVECYYERDGDVYLDVSQRQPVMRVITEYGDDYYLDSNGKRLSIDNCYAVDVPLVTGYVDDVIYSTHLLPLVESIEAHPFWSHQILQICVTESHEITLYPRVGDHVILLGGISNHEEKLQSVLAIYQQIIPEVGWNAYDTISVKYNDQVVCTRRNKKYRHNTWKK